MRTNCDTTITPITDAAGNQVTGDQPALSPDGTKVAFRGNVTSGSANTTEVFVVPSDGGAVMQTTHLGGAVWRVNWAPDSQHLVLSDDASGVAHVYTARWDGSGLTSLDPNFAAYDPAWCGSKIVVNHPDGSTPNGETAHLYTMNVTDGSGITQITSSGFLDDWPACTPDNKWVVYSDLTSANALSDLDVIPITGGTSVLLRPGQVGSLLEPTVANDWTMAFWPSGSDQIFFQWLGDRWSVGNGSGLAEWPSFSQGDGSIPPPAGFPVSWYSTNPSPSPSPTPTATPTPTPTPTSACSAVQFIGLRGSGEKENDYGGLGYTIQNVANAFAGQIPSTQITHIDYPAIAVGYSGVYYNLSYIDSEDAGTTLALAHIRKVIRECPRTLMVLAGYSQGAHAAGDAYQFLSTSERKHIAAVVLLGDPRFNHKQKRGVNVGTFNALDGVFSIVQKPRDITGTDVNSVRSFCIGGDPICNSSPPNIASCVSNLLFGLCPHLLYVDQGWADRAGLWAAYRVKSLM